MMSQPFIQSENEPLVLARIEKNIGWITLNREKALNSLNQEMVSVLSAALKDWAVNPEVKFVIIQGKGRAFCAGGDVRNFYYAHKEGNLKETYQFFKDEYSLNHFIKFYPKPYISLINGYCMGGGMGISMHGSHRIVTENARLAMPETTIGFFPDVGGTYFFSRLPKNLGVYLGLTGALLTPEDSVYTGLATHFILASQLEELITRFQSIQFTSSPLNQIDSLLQQYASSPGSSQIERHSDGIDRLFNQTSMKDLLNSLEKENTDFTRQTLEILKTKSPTSLKVVLKALRLAKELSFKDCIKLEYRLALEFIKRVDFAEGVRALLIDKDKTPQWNPSSLAQVSSQAVDAYFAPRDDELNLE